MGCLTQLQQPRIPLLLNKTTHSLALRRNLTDFGRDKTVENLSK